MTYVFFLLKISEGTNSSYQESGKKTSTAAHGGIESEQKGIRLGCICIKPSWQVSSTTSISILVSKKKNILPVKKGTGIGGYLTFSAKAIHKQAQKGRSPAHAFAGLWLVSEALWRKLYECFKNQNVPPTCYLSSKRNTTGTSVGCKN